MSRPAVKVRLADHAGSWYSNDAQKLHEELQNFLSRGSAVLHDIETVSPVQHARVIIAPHAGYSYSGPTAGVAYRALDLNEKTANVFVLGPSHHVYLETATLSSCDELATPLGNLVVNREIISELQQTNSFEQMSKAHEEAEHSLEMQYPFVKILIDQIVFSPADQQRPKIVPIMIGNTSASTEERLGQILAPYLQDERNVFVVSSDFAHWGRRFNYTYYVPKQTADYGGGSTIKKDSQISRETPIHQSISRVDHECMHAIESGTHSSFLHALSKTGNTVCGRHPIGVMISAMECLKRELKLHSDLCNFTFTDYQRSSLVSSLSDSSVSYASAFAKIQCMDVMHFLKQIKHLPNEEESILAAAERRRKENDYNAMAALVAAQARGAMAPLGLDSPQTAPPSFSLEENRNNGAKTSPNIEDLYQGLFENQLERASGGGGNPRRNSNDSMIAHEG